MGPTYQHVFLFSSLFAQSLNSVLLIVGQSHDGVNRGHESGDRDNEGWHKRRVVAA
jgi:hypothetical protein